MKGRKREGREDGREEGMEEGLRLTYINYKVYQYN